MMSVAARLRYMAEVVWADDSREHCRGSANRSEEGAGVRVAQVSRHYGAGTCSVAAAMALGESDAYSAEHAQSV